MAFQTSTQKKCNVCTASFNPFRRRSTCSSCMAHVCSNCYLKVTTGSQNPIEKSSRRCKVCTTCLSSKQISKSVVSLSSRAPILLHLAIESTPTSTPTSTASNDSHMRMAPRFHLAAPEPCTPLSHDHVVSMTTGVDAPMKMQMLMARLLSLQDTTEHIMNTTKQLNSPVA
ncbi:hypothetical protein THRCLA_11697 [Thraustotheca clavata]|uniref:FYVE-type domain-containing protein n=1 Tax=Thraustotheca clavata TaxID=74557 RepID=A0A1V9Y6Y0_9STRA|nr:hypothetical protein THRCLA_11697 [Thraustotheca clavata]